MDDNWIGEYERLTGLADEIQGDISQKANSSAVRRKLNALTSELATLSNELAKVEDDPRTRLTDRELGRRKNLLQSLTNRKETLTVALNSSASISTTGEKLFETKGKSWAAAAAPKETDAQKEMNNQQLLQQQRDLLGIQDQSLDRLGAIMKGTKNMALTLGDEIVDQTQMAERLGQHVDDTSHGVRRETKRIRDFEESDSSGACFYWIVIAILIAVLILMSSTRGLCTLIKGRNNCG